MGDNRRNLEFRRWAGRQRTPDHLDEGLLDFIRKRGTTSLDKEEAWRGGTKAAGVIGKVGKALANPVGAGLEYFAGIATAALSGNLGEAWEKVKDITQVFSDVGEMASAGSALPKVLRHKGRMVEHLRAMNIQEKAAAGIVQAVFEVDLAVVAMVPPMVWPKAVKAFLAGLDAGYDSLGEKVFAAVLHRAITEAFSGLQGQADSLAAHVASLLQAFKAPDVQQVLSTAASPQAARSPAARRIPEFDYERPGEDRGPNEFRSMDYGVAQYQGMEVVGVLLRSGPGEWRLTPQPEHKHNYEFWRTNPQIKSLPIDMNARNVWVKNQGFWHLNIKER